MKKTFEELLEKEYYYINDGLGKVVDIEDCLDLMKLIRQKTIEECSNKTKADYDIINTSERAELFRENNIECYVLKESILQLDLNSIEI